VQTKKRVIILDYGGTLLTKEPWGKYLKKDVSATSGRKPRQGILESVKALSEKEGNIVVVVTGTARANLQMVFPDSEGFNKLGLAASDGKVFSWGSGRDVKYNAGGDGTSTVEVDGGRTWTTAKHTVSERNKGDSKFSTLRRNALHFPLN